MMKTARNYREVKVALGSLTPFKHSTCSGGWRTTEYGPVYVVKSYATDVAWVDATTTVIRENGEVGGVTTSKQLGYARAYLPAHGHGHVEVATVA